MPKAALRIPEFIALFALITSLTAISIDALLPGLHTIGRDLAVSDSNSTQLVISMFILGMVFGELIFGPLSDTIGRKAAILIGLAIYAAGTCLAMTASSLEQIVIGRIIQGIGVSGPKIASRALIRDLYEGEAMARIMSFIFAIFVIVPMLGPAIGQFVINFADWRAIFILYLAFAAIAGAWLAIRQPETLAAQRRLPFSPGIIRTNAWLILSHPRIVAYMLAAGFVFGTQLLFLSTAPSLFRDLYGVTGEFSFYFALLAFGIGIASFSNSQLVTRYGMYRLSVMALGVLSLNGAAFWAIGLAYSGVPPFIIFMALCFLHFCCVGMLLGNLNAMAMRSLGRIAGLGASMMASISSLVAVCIAVPFGKIYDQTVLPMSISFLLAGIFSLALIAFAERLRAEPI